MDIMSHYNILRSVQYAHCVLSCDEGHMILGHVIIGHMIITLCRSVVNTTNYGYIMCDGI